MENIVLEVERDDVYAEVQKNSDYAGAMAISEDAPGARDRMLATDDDLKTLGRFWDEAVAVANREMREMLERGVSTLKDYRHNGILTEVYEATLAVSRSWNKALTPVVESSLRSYFVASVTGQWFRFVNAGECEAYLAKAQALLEGAVRMLWERRAPRL